jgi:hypothetical protein
VAKKEVFIIKIDKKLVKCEVNAQKEVAHYSVGDIEGLIKNDLLSNGYDCKSIRIVTRYKYCDDEWGMNRSLITYLDHIEADI